MQATLGHHVPHQVARRSDAPERRLDGARATLSALGSAVLAVFGVYRH
jgi:hypothetical protein